jgi:hypothetical protein
LQGGNADLTPETADTWTIGLTITPELVPQFTASIDYYSIELEDGVDTLPAGPILNCVFGFDPHQARISADASCLQSSVHSQHVHAERRQRRGGISCRTTEPRLPDLAA